MSQQYELYLVAKTLRNPVNPNQSLHLAAALESYRNRRRGLLARKRFYQLYRLRNLLFRFTPRLANRLAL